MNQEQKDDVFNVLQVLQDLTNLQRIDQISYVKKYEKWTTKHPIIEAKSKNLVSSLHGPHG